MDYKKLQEQEENRVKKILLTDAAVILATIQEVEEVGGTSEYRKGQYNEILTLLNVLYGMSPRRVNRALRTNVNGIKAIDYKAIFKALHIE